jgi:hypothetical protein
MRTLGQLPIASLFPTFYCLNGSERLRTTLERVLESLKLDVNEDSAILSVPNPSDPFQRHFETLLLGDQELSKLRLKLCVVDFCWVRSVPPV